LVISLVCECVLACAKTPPRSLIPFCIVLQNKQKMPLRLIQHRAINSYREMEVYIHIFLTSALIWGEWSASRPGRFILEKNLWFPPLVRRLGSPSKRCWGFGEETYSLPLSRIELRFLCHLACSIVPIYFNDIVYLPFHIKRVWMILKGNFVILLVNEIAECPLSSSHFLFTT
jgi:hypothetical protein